MWQAGPGSTRATCERANALCARADALVDRTTTLRMEVRHLLADTADARRRSLELRRCRQGSKILVLPARLLTPPPPLRTSGRITRRTKRRSLAASSGPRPDDAPSHEEWALAAVYATRIVDVVAEHDDVGDVPLRWTIREIDARNLPGARGPRCLVFENHRVVRRIWHYPADWAIIAPSALLALASLP